MAGYHLSGKVHWRECYACSKQERGAINEDLGAVDACGVGFSVSGRLRKARTPVEETEEAGGAEVTTVEETTNEKTNERAKATTEETTLAKATAQETTPTAEAAVLEALLSRPPSLLVA